MRPDDHDTLLRAETRPDAGDLVRVLDAEGRADSSKRTAMDRALVVGIYEAMLRTRLVDERLFKLQRQGRIGFHVGSMGEEAAIIASVAALRPTDWIVPCYREWGALLYRGWPLQTYVDHMMGNADDPVHGRQMPAHVLSRELHYLSVSAPVGTQIPHAVGVSFAARRLGKDEVAAVFFGDGATSSNDFHAGMNLAGVWKTPTIFLCRNNQFAISVPVAEQTAAPTIASKAAAYGIPAVRVDGNDALAVYRVVDEAVTRASRGHGPTFVELVTYRLGGHSTSDDPTIYRSEDEVERARTTDPIPRLRRYLETQGAWDEAREKRFVASIEDELREVIAAAEAKEPPPLEDVFGDVFAAQPPHLRAQQEEALATRRRGEGGDR